MSEKKWKVHYTAFKSFREDKPVHAACGPWKKWRPGEITNEKAEVTCGLCKRTRKFERDR